MAFLLLSSLQILRWMQWSLLHSSYVRAGVKAGKKRGKGLEEGGEADGIWMSRCRTWLCEPWMSI